ncbi:hypothetical protein PINS_up000563 [Pythium insidiosum]|nr:hypothetical protein PINS_up000563 [Pythium insidiosum]
MMRQRPVHGEHDGASAVDAPESEMSKSARRALKRVDVYPKMHREFKVQTEFGATVSLVMTVVMVILFLAELKAYLYVHTHEHMVVDSTINEKLQINVDISFLAINCKDAHINAMDVAGDLQMDMHQTIKKSRLDQNGKQIGRSISVARAGDDAPKTELPQGYCGSCYDAPHPSGKKCCNTCDEVKEAFIANDISLEEADQKEQCLRESVLEESQAQEGEGCRFEGKMLVNRVAGNFHVALGRTFHREGRLVHQFRPGEELTFNASHVIHSLSFGIPVKGVSGPLDGVRKVAEKQGGVFQYFIKVVPTIYSDIGPDVHSYQFSYTEQARYLEPTGQMSALPGAFFVFDLSPFMVKVENDRMPFTHFLTKICAIIGGVVSIASFVDSFMYNSLNVKKMPMSK